MTQKEGLAPVGWPSRMDSTAIIFEKPGSLAVRSLQLVDPAEGDIVVESLWSGISTGTEKMLYQGSMPAFPGMGYPLVPGYETVGRVASVCDGANAATDVPAAGTLVFVPGARCYRDAAGLFGASASKLVVPAGRVIAVDEALGRNATLLSIAATAFHAVSLAAGPPELIVGHGLVGRLAARICLALGYAPPLVFETNPDRRNGSQGYEVIDPARSGTSSFSSVLDASGSPEILDIVIPRLAPGGEVVLAGFYGERLSLPFVPAFMREARIRIAAEFKTGDTHAVLDLVSDSRLSLDGLISHTADHCDADLAYATAFNDPACVKMLIDWRKPQ